MTHVKDTSRRWMYNHSRPNRVAALLNRGTAAVAAAGIAPKRLATLEVRGRRSGRRRSFPVVVAEYEGQRYVVAMLGNQASWVRNVRAAGGEAVLCHGRRERVRLEELDAAIRAPILRRYLQVAPGARAHFPLDPGASLQEFEGIAEEFPVFRVCAALDSPRGGPAMKIEYLHASKYGNGAAVAEEFHNQMAGRGAVVAVHHIRDVSPTQLEPADLYVFSSPGRMGKPIRGMRRFLKRVKLPPGTRYAILTTEVAPKPNKKTGRTPTEEELAKWQRVRPIMNELLEAKGLVNVAEDKILVTGLKGPLEQDWEKKVQAFVTHVSNASGIAAQPAPPNSLTSHAA